MYSEFSRIESSYLLFKNSIFKVLRWIQDPVNIQNRAELFAKIVIIFAVLYFHRNFPLRFWQGLELPLEFKKRGEEKHVSTIFNFYDVISCVNKNFITHLEKENRYDIETLSIARVLNEEYLYGKIMQKMYIKNYSQNSFSFW